MDIHYHPSFEPVDKIFAAWDAVTPTPKEAARVLIKQARAEIKTPEFTEKNRKLMAQSWGVMPRGARRSVLMAAGMSADDWERPIDSFTEQERAAMRAAARAAVAVYERVLNAI